MNKTALVTGATGQCGSFLVEQLLKQNYSVFALIRRSATNNTSNIDHLINDIEVIEGDLTDSFIISESIRLIKPDCIFNTAAQSHVGYSFKNPQQTFNVNFGGILNLLEAIRLHSPNSRLLQWSTSEMFGGIYNTPCNEDTILYPRSPYGVSKVAAHHLVINYRESYNLFACCVICFNNESERRGLNFVTRKATRSAAEIKLGLRKDVGFGNIETYRDWGYTPDYMQGCIMILDHDKPEEFVLSTGETHCIKDMLRVVFDYAGLGPYKNYIYTDPKFYRPADIDVLIGDSSKAKDVLGWEPTTSFEDMMKRMYDNDLKILSEEHNVPIS